MGVDMHIVHAHGDCCVGHVAGNYYVGKSGGGHIRVEDVCDWGTARTALRYPSRSQVGTLAVGELAPVVTCLRRIFRTLPFVGCANLRCV